MKRRNCRKCMIAFPGLLLLLATACGTEKKEMPVSELQHELLMGDEFVIGRLRDLTLLNDTLPFAVGNQSDKVFQVFDYHRQEIREYGNRGQGPDDLLFVTTPTVGKDGVISFWDGNRRRYSQMWFEEGDSMPRFRHLFAYTEEQRTGMFHFNVLPVGENRFLSIGLYEDCRWILLDEEGNRLKGFGEYPYQDEEERRVSGYIRGEVYQGFPVLSPDGNKLVLPLLSADIISFYDITAEGDLKLRSEQVRAYPTDYNRENAAMSASSPNYYIGACATDSRVYLLYSGRNLKEHKDKASESQTIHVYDWDGCLVQTLHTDVPLTEICITPDGSKLFAIALMPEPSLVAFELPV